MTGQGIVAGPSEQHQPASTGVPLHVHGASTGASGGHTGGGTSPVLPVVAPRSGDWSSLVAAAVAVPLVPSPFVPEEAPRVVPLPLVEPDAVAPPSPRQPKRHGEVARAKTRKKETFRGIPRATFMASNTAKCRRSRQGHGWDTRGRISCLRRPGGASTRPIAKPRRQDGARIRHGWARCVRRI